MTVRSACLALCCLAFQLALAGPLSAQFQPPAESAVLFASADEDVALDELPREAQQRALAVLRSPATAEMRITRLAVEDLAPVAFLELNLFRDVVLRAEKTAYEVRTGGGFSWYGIVPVEKGPVQEEPPKPDEEDEEGDDPSPGTPEDGAVLLVSAGVDREGSQSGLPRLEGKVSFADQVYSIHSLGDGFYSIRRLDQSRFREHPEEFHQSGTVQEPGGSGGTGTGGTAGSSVAGTATSPAAGTSRWSPAPAGKGLQALIEATQTPTIVTVLVGFTPGAAAAHGNIGALIQQSIDEANISYTNTNVNLRMALLATQETPYVETNDIATDLARLTDPGDGFMDELHVRRDELGADVVVVILDNDEACGIAEAIRANEAEAFAVVHWDCSVDNHSFPHEVGHLQGARHDTANDSSNTPFKYGHGARRKFKSYRTVMAYPCGWPWNCPRVLYWSSPDVEYKNKKTGDASRRDNARVLRETAGDVAAFRSSGPWPFDNAWSNGGSGSVDWWNLGPADLYVAGNFIAGNNRDELLATNPASLYAHMMTFNGSSWSTAWSNLGSGSIHWWNFGPADRYVAGDFTGNGQDELFAINPNGYAHLMTYSGSWGTIWSNLGSGIIDSWYIGGADKYVAGDFLTGNGRDELLAINPNGWSHLMVYNGSSWTTAWSNLGSGAIHWWFIGGADRYLSGNFNGAGGDELLAINPNGFSHMMNYSGSWGTTWSNLGSGAIHWWSIGSSDRYLAGDFLAGNGRDELLAVAPNNGWAHMIAYDGANWQWQWGNAGIGSFGFWMINYPDRYLAGTFSPSNAVEEILTIQPSNGWVQLHEYSP